MAGKVKPRVEINKLRPFGTRKEADDAMLAEYARIVAQKGRN